MKEILLMTHAPNGAASNGPSQPALADPFQLQRSLLTTWLRSTRATLGLAAGSQQLLYDRGRALAGALADVPAQTELPLVGSQRAWWTLFDWWADGAAEAADLVDAALVELRFSAGDLLAELQQEQAAHQRTQAERDRARESLERERAQRRQVEQERDAAQARAEQLQTEQRRSEREAQRLQRELADLQAQLERAERTLAEAQSTAPNAPADTPAVNVVRREDDWAVMRDEAKRASRVFETKREAVQRAREIARKDGVELHVQPANGNGSEG
jgi:hypothetical protein